MKLTGKFLIAIFIFPLLFYPGCFGDNPLQNIKDYVPNQEPVISLVESDYDGSAVVPGLLVVIIVYGHDSDEGPIDYVFTSSSGSFMNKNVFDDRCEIDFIVGVITGGEEVSVSITVVDEKGVSTGENFVIGQSSLGPVVTEVGSVNPNLAENESVDVSFTANCDGFYQVRVYDDVSTTPSFDENLPCYFYNRNTESTFTVSGAYGPAGDVTLNPYSSSPDKVCVIVRDGMLQDGFFEIEFTVFDGTPPAISNSTLNTPGVDYDRVTVTWTEANDTGSPQSALEYSIYTSSSNDISSISQIDAGNGTLRRGWTADISSVTITGLRMQESYYVNVLVRDEAGNRSIYSSRYFDTPESIFLYTTLYSSSGVTWGERYGDFGNRSAANSICWSNPNRHSGCSSAAAVLSYSTSDSVQNFPSNYGMPADVEIVGRQSFVVMADNWNDLLTNGPNVPIINNASINTVYGHWTGSNSDGSFDSAASCSLFTSSAGGFSKGSVGRPDAMATWLDQGEPATCDTQQTILCVCW